MVKALYLKKIKSIYLYSKATGTTTVAKQWTNLFTINFVLFRTKPDMFLKTIIGFQVVHGEKYVSQSH